MRPVLKRTVRSDGRSRGGPGAAPEESPFETPPLGHGGKEPGRYGCVLAAAKLWHEEWIP